MWRLDSQANFCNFVRNKADFSEKTSPWLCLATVGTGDYVIVKAVNHKTTLKKCELVKLLPGRNFLAFKY